MSSKFWFIAAPLVILGGLLIFKPHAQKSDEAILTIGIIQTATHPALDETRESFIAQLSELLHGNVRFVIQNAEGSLPQAQSIAESFHTHKKIKAIFAIGTPAVQAASRVEKQKPIFIAAVSDPESLGIIFPGTNICGTTDRIDTDAQAELIRSMFPSAKTVAIIFNPGETNSQVMVEKMKASLANRGLHHASFGVHSENEIAQTVAAASRKADLILVPADNLIAGAMPLVSKEALKKGRPVVASDILLVKKGALFASGASYSDLGKKTAVMAHKVLILAVTPQEAGLVNPTDTKIFANTKITKELHICIPEDLLPKTVLIEDNGGSP
jgi:putative tryptophan/tyrosine transport system substrate-binding protein